MVATCFARRPVRCASHGVSFARIGTIGRAAPSAKLDPTNAAQVANMPAVRASASMLPAFVATATASARPQAARRDIEPGVPDRQFIGRT
jgi:hypothetical protein